MSTTTPHGAPWSTIECQCDPTYGQSCRECDGTAAEEIEAARDAEAARAPLPDSAPRICDSSGLLAVLATDGEGYDWLACLGCAGCRGTVGGVAAARAAVSARGAFAGIPQADDEEF